MIPAGQFLAAPTKHLRRTWTADIKALEGILDLAARPSGVDESTLLQWFGASEHRVALLAYSLTGFPPTHIARELTIGRFRADFAWANVQPDTIPVFGFVEFEHALFDTLFKKGARSVPYIGASFLAGFSQLVDWCSFGETEAKQSPAVSSLMGAHRYAAQAEYTFALVAGMDSFAADVLSQQRLAWWKLNVKLGHGTQMLTYTRLCMEARKGLKYLK